MSQQSVREYFATRNLDIPIIELTVSTATVELAALAHGVEAGRIAKTLSFRLNDGQAIMLVARGDARIDNRKFKDTFGKGRMLPAAGAIHSSVRISPARLAEVTAGQWVDVCKL